MGQLIGGFFATTLLGLLIGLAFKSKEPDPRALSATMCAWVCASILAGFGMADGGSFRFDAALMYLPGAAGTFFFLRWHYGKMWTPDEEDIYEPDAPDREN
jgi:peptidoglycan/LPS O-acetylase OafA/YrhL